MPREPERILRLVEGPMVEAVSLEDAKEGAKIQFASEDALVRTWLDAAAELAHVHTDGRQLISATYALDLDGFPCDREPIELPRPPLQEIVSITYYDTDGEQQTLDDESYYTLTPHKTAGLLYLVPGATWPSTQCRPNAATINFVAGYGDDPSSVPAAIRYGIQLCVNYWNRHRDDPLDACPPGVLALFRSCRAGFF